MASKTPNGRTPSSWGLALHYTLYLVLWLLFSALALLLIYWLRTNFFDLAVWLRFNPWAVRGIDRGAIYVLGIGWLLFMFWVENYLRTAIEKNLLYARAKRLFLYELMALAVSYGLLRLLGASNI